jgi:cardiolipin synthase A/B
MIIDAVLVSVGSTNFDNRSFRLNDEASLNLFDRGFALTMTDVFEADLRHSERVTYEAWKKRPFLHKLRELVAEPWSSQL